MVLDVKNGSSGYAWRVARAAPSVSAAAFSCVLPSEISEHGARLRSNPVT